MVRVRSLVVMIVSIALPLISRADTVYSTLGRGDTYNQTIGYSILGPASGYGSQADAASFVAGANYTLTELDLALAFDSGSSSSVVVKLLTDNGGLPSSSVLESWTIDVPAYPGGVQSLISNPIALNAGSQYWIATFAFGDTVAEWFWNTAGVNDVAGSHDGGASWNLNTPTPEWPDQPAPAFRVQGVSAVPEPSCLLMVGTGLAGCVGVLRRKIKT